MKTTFRSTFILMLAVLACGICPAQETRSTIYGRVLDPQVTSVAGARVTVTNTATNTVVKLVTNATGYYEASLLLAGAYVVEAEAAGFKKTIRRGIEVSIGTRAEINMQLELGSVSESLSVTAEAPVLNTSDAASGRLFDHKALDLPLPSGNALQLARLTPGVQTTGNLNYNPEHAFGTDQFFLPGNFGGTEYTIDGAPNNGSARNPGYQPHADTLQEVRVETANFDASIGHTMGVTVNMMTKSGSNQLHGSANWEYFDFKIMTGADFFTKQLYYSNINRALGQGNQALADDLRKQPMQTGGNWNSFAGAIGGPIVIPKVINGKNKLFFFFSTDDFHLSRAPTNNISGYTVATVPQRTGDFSDLLKVNAALYQIYDPLTVRADPARAGHFIRDSFPGNIVPQARQINPVASTYLKFLPLPNANPLNPTSEPTTNFQALGMPFIDTYYAYTNRIDYNHSEKHRFFGRWSWNDFNEDLYDWTYQTYRGLSTAGLNRHNAAAMVDWVYTRSASTMLDVSVGVTQFRDGYHNSLVTSFQPSQVGLPAYMDAQSGPLHILPDMFFTGYTPLGPAAAQRTGYPVLTQYRMGEAKAALTHVRGKHSLSAGVDLRQHFRTGGGGGSTAGAFTFDNTYTRRNDDTFTPAGSLGLSWASFLLGIPSAMRIDNNATYVTSNPYFGWFFQDNWRLSSKLTLNFGLRLEYEQAPRERFNRAITYFDPTATLPITQAAQSAYAQNPIPELPASQFSVIGGSLYAGTNGASSRIWRNELMWLPRASVAYQIDSKTVARGGYGMFYDTNNVLIFTPDQTGFSFPTSTTVTNNFGTSWLVGNPGAGVSPLTDPFPVRSDGTRFSTPPGSSLGLMARAGQGWSERDYNFQHARMNRWRAGFQRQISTNTIIEVAYAGSYTDHIPLSKSLSSVPGQYYNTTSVRNDAIATNLNANVTNPFYLANFSGLQTTNAQLYQQLSTLGFFTSPTIRKSVLLQAFPQMNGLTNLSTSIGKARANDIEISLQRRFSKGLEFNFGYTRLWQKDADYFANPYDSEPSWQLSNNGRPHRIVASGVYELPFGRGRSLATKGIPSKLLGGFQIGLTYDYQPGPLVQWGNLFYNGDPSNIATDNRTLDHWINTDGFVRSSAAQPTSFQARVFPTRIEGVRSDSVNIWYGEIHRVFRIRESVNFQIRADALNLFNRSQFAAPVADPTSTNFGRVIATSGSVAKRTVQLQARIVF